jgi:hypothetical protein
VRKSLDLLRVFEGLEEYKKWSERRDSKSFALVCQSPSKQGISAWILRIMRVGGFDENEVKYRFCGVFL